MKDETYNALLKDLQKLQKTLVASQIDAVRRDPVVATRLARLHNEAEVGGGVDDFVATTARRSTVLFLLRSVFVRVLEDLGILGLKRIRDEWGFAAFREVAPALGLRSYFAFVFRDLAADFPALFAAQDDELPLPNEDGCRALWNLWHHPNRDGELYVWNGDGFASRFLGDLYEDLDADIRKRYALLQTPPFVEEYILDHTLTPALAEFGPAELRAAGATFRVLDPTCGSGHFLIGTFHRLADYWRDGHALSEWDACERALESVWGSDINPHAIEIASFRLLLEVVARTGEKELERLADLKLNLRAMDSLVPWERTATQGELFPAHDRLHAYATPQQRRANAAFLAHEFHVVVGNPPYIQPADARKADDYRAFWPDSCFKEFCLHEPFLERFLVLGTNGAFTGQITANNFAKRSHGKSVITKVLSRWRTTAVIDTSLAPIPGHGWKGGTSTLILFGRCLPFASEPIPWVLAKRRESTGIKDPATSQAWLAIRNADLRHDQQGPYVDVQLRPAETVASWPWDLRGQAGQDIVSAMEKSTPVRLDHVRRGRIGVDVITRAPDLFEWSSRDGLRLGLPTPLLRPFGDGKDIRDWHAELPQHLLVPYRNRLPVTGSERDEVVRALWPWRRSLSTRFVSGGVTLADKRLPFFSIPQVPWHKHETMLSIVFPFVTTEPHFTIVNREAWFKHSVSLIKLPPTITEDECYSVVGALNSSSASFWLRGKFKGTGRVRELWEDWIQIDEKLGEFPVPQAATQQISSLSVELTKCGQARAECLPGYILASGDWTPTSVARSLAAARERYESLTFRMVALQEELDWCVYGSFGLIDPVLTAAPAAVEPLRPGHRPFEIVFARQDDEADEEEKSAWWSRHRHDRVTVIPDSYSASQRARLQQRIDLIGSDPRLELLESTAYKRRWAPVDWPKETTKAAETWLLDRLEDLFAPASATSSGGALVEAKPYRLEDIVSAWSRDPCVAAVAGVWAGSGASVDVTLVAETLLRRNAVPDNPHRVYTEEGLRQLTQWKRVWALQEQEDERERNSVGKPEREQTASARAFVDPDDPSKEVDAVPRPPPFKKLHFAKGDVFAMRGDLNVPRERFILFADLQPNRFGWNGWRDRARALAQVEAFNLAESDPQEPLHVPTYDDPRRCGVTFGLWESLPDMRRWGAAEEYAELQALAREACRQPRCPCPLVDAWKATVLHRSAAEEAILRPKATAKVRRETVSLAQRAWVVSLFETGTEVDAAGVWAQHRGRLGGPAQLSMPGVSVGPVQLTMHVVSGEAALEHASLDETQLARVLDDLVASGDLQVSGRGRKKRFQLVTRGG